MKILRANYVSYSWENCLNHHFEAPNPLEYGWKESEGKLEPFWFEGHALPSLGEVNQEQDCLDTLPEFNESSDSSSSDSDDENEGLYLSNEDDA